MSQSPKRPYAQVAKTARNIVSAIAPYCQRVEIAGSLRRQRPMIGDIEIVALPMLSTNLFGESTNSQPTMLDLLDRFLAGRHIRFLKNGSKYKQFKYGDFMVDLFLPESAAHWGTVYLIRTGSHEFNMWLMTVAQKAAGVKFANGRLLDWQGHFINTPEEADVFAALNLPVVPVTMRDNGAWVEYIKQETSNA